MRRPAGTEATSPGDAASTEVAGPQGRLVVPACPFGGVLALVPVVMVQEVVHDDAGLPLPLANAVGAAGGEGGGGARRSWLTGNSSC